MCSLTTVTTYLQVFPDKGCKREIALLKKKCICGMLISISDYKVKKGRKGDNII